MEEKTKKIIDLIKEEFKKAAESGGESKNTNYIRKWMVSVSSFEVFFKIIESENDRNVLFIAFSSILFQLDNNIELLSEESLKIAFECLIAFLTSFPFDSITPEYSPIFTYFYSSISDLLLSFPDREELIKVVLETISSKGFAISNFLHCYIKQAISKHLITNEIIFLHPFILESLISEEITKDWISFLSDSISCDSFRTDEYTPILEKISQITDYTLYDGVISFIRNVLMQNNNDFSESAVFMDNFFHFILFFSQNLRELEVEGIEVMIASLWTSILSMNNKFLMKKCESEEFDLLGAILDEIAEVFKFINYENPNFNDFIISIGLFINYLSEFAPSEFVMLCLTFLFEMLNSEFENYEEYGNSEGIVNEYEFSQVFQSIGFNSAPLCKTLLSDESNVSSPAFLFFASEMLEIEQLKDFAEDILPFLFTGEVEFSVGFALYLTKISEARNDFLQKTLEVFIENISVNENFIVMLLYKVVRRNVNAIVSEIPSFVDVLIQLLSASVNKFILTSLLIIASQIEDNEELFTGIFQILNQKLSEYTENEEVLYWFDSLSFATNGYQHFKNEKSESLLSSILSEIIQEETVKSIFLCQNDDIQESVAYFVSTTLSSGISLPVEALSEWISQIIPISFAPRHCNVLQFLVEVGCVVAFDEFSAFLETFDFSNISLAHSILSYILKLSQAIEPENLILLLKPCFVQLSLSIGGSISLHAIDVYSEIFPCFIMIDEEQMKQYINILCAYLFSPFSFHDSMFEKCLNFLNLLKEKYGEYIFSKLKEISETMENSQQILQVFINLFTDETKERKCLINTLKSLL